MVNTAANQEREMRVAVERVVGFAQEFGEAHLNLACHAAFPLSLTPDLLYQIWANFVPEAPWTAVARVLLSRLCKEVGAEMYEMDNAVRNLLLRELKVQFGQERFDSLGEFLLEYVSQRLTEDDPDTQDLRQAQEWTALAYTKPKQAAKELAQVLSDKVQQEDIGEVLRLSSLVETLSEPLVEAGFEPLLIYSKGCLLFSIGKKENAQTLLNTLSNNVKIEGVKLFDFWGTSHKKVKVLVNQVRSYLCEKNLTLYDQSIPLSGLTINLDTYYIDVYLLKDYSIKSSSTFKEIRDISNRPDSNKQTKRISGLKAVKQFSKLIVLGSPGMGKSTFLRHLAVVCCKKLLFPNCIPILIKLRSIDNMDQFNLLNHIHKEFMFGEIEHTKQILIYGKVFILLDGFDEIPNSSQPIFQKKLINFCQKYYKNNFILTTRIEANKNIIPDFQYVEIAETNDRKIEIDAENIFINLASTRQQGIKVKDDFVEKIKQSQNQQIAELISNPFFLNLVCLIFLNNENIPFNYTDLLEQSLKLILSRWDLSKSNTLEDKVYEKLTLSEKLQLLSNIAAIDFEKSEYFFKKDTLINTINNYFNNLSKLHNNIQTKNINAEVILKSIVNQHGILVERHQGIYSFSHLIFQEYLTAKYIIENYNNIQNFQNTIHLINKESWNTIKTLIKEMKPDMKI